MDYTLPNDWSLAEERLSLLGAAYDPGSIALAQQLGVSPGWRCLEEGDGLGMLGEMPGAFGEVWRAFARSTETAGANQSWARTLPTRLAALGLVDIWADADIPFFRGDSPMARMWSLTWAQAHEALVVHGVSQETIAVAQRELADEQRWLYAPPTVRVSARAPR